MFPALNNSFVNLEARKLTPPPVKLIRASTCVCNEENPLPISTLFTKALDAVKVLMVILL